MGYTHYWEVRSGSIPAEAVAILQEILDAAYEDGVVQYEHDDTLPLVVTETQVRFNGVDEEGHETFLFDMSGGNRQSDGFRFDFCKTARKPCDTLVMKVLIILKYYLGDVSRSPVTASSMMNGRGARRNGGEVRDGHRRR